jgi:hypothetical protein
MRPFHQARELLIRADVEQGISRSSYAKGRMPGHGFTKSHLQAKMIFEPLFVSVIHG